MFKINKLSCLYYWICGSWDFEKPITITQKITSTIITMIGTHYSEKEWIDFIEESKSIDVQINLLLFRYWDWVQIFFVSGDTSNRFFISNLKSFNFYFTDKNGFGPSCKWIALIPLLHCLRKHPKGKCNTTQEQKYWNNIEIDNLTFKLGLLPLKQIIWNLN